MGEKGAGSGPEALFETHSVHPATWLQEDRTHVGLHRGLGRRPSPFTARVRHGRAFLGTVLCLAFAPVAAAKPSLAIIPFGRHPVERQLTQALCREVTCVSAGTVTRQGRVDWGRVAAAELTGVLMGKIGREPTSKRRYLDIQVLAPGHVILVRRKLPLQALALSATSLQALTAELVGGLRRAHGPERVPPPVRVAPAAPEAPVPPGESAPASPPPPSPPPVSPPAPTSGPGASSAESPAEPEAPQAQEREPPLLEVEATFALVSRQYSYAARAVNLTLRDATVPFAGEPGLALGIFPVRSPTGALQAFGVEAGLATGVGMTIRRDNDASGTLFPAVSLSATVALTARLRVSKAVRLGPTLGWQMMNFAVQKAADGTVLSGQPPVHWRALRAGLKLDVDLSAWCTAFFEASYLYTYTAGPLTSAPYFTSSTPGLSFDTALGLAFHVAPRLDVRLAFVFTRFAVNFTGPGPAPVSGVSDQLLGGLVGVRYSY